MSQENVEFVRNVYAMLSRGDAEIWDLVPPDFALDFSRRLINPVMLLGPDEVRAFTENEWQVWEDGSVSWQPEELIDAGDKVLASAASAVAGRRAASRLKLISGTCGRFATASSPGGRTSERTELRPSQPSGCPSKTLTAESCSASRCQWKLSLPAAALNGPGERIPVFFREISVLFTLSHLAVSEALTHGPLPSPSLSSRSSSSSFDSVRFGSAIRCLCQRCATSDAWTQTRHHGERRGPPRLDGSSGCALNRSSAWRAVASAA
jgi:ketosteroid isomerase-like protein